MKPKSLFFNRAKMALFALKVGNGLVYIRVFESEPRLLYFISTYGTAFQNFSAGFAQ